MAFAALVGALVDGELVEPAGFAVAVLVEAGVVHLHGLLEDGGVKPMSRAHGVPTRADRAFDLHRAFVQGDIDLLLDGIPVDRELRARDVNVERPGNEEPARLRFVLHVGVHESPFDENSRAILPCFFDAKTSAGGDDDVEPSENRTAGAFGGALT